MGRPVQIILKVTIFLQKSLEHFLQVKGSNLSLSLSQDNLLQVHLNPLILPQTDNLISIRAFDCPKPDFFLPFKWIRVLNQHVLFVNFVDETGSGGADLVKFGALVF